MKTWARLVSISDHQIITRERDRQFWFEYQRAVLLGLKELGTLDEMQYQDAEAALKRTFPTLKNWSGGEERR